MAGVVIEATILVVDRAKLTNEACEDATELARVEVTIAGAAEEPT